MKVICYVNVENHFLTFTKHITFTRIMLGMPLFVINNHTEIYFRFSLKCGFHKIVVKLNVHLLISSLSLMDMRADTIITFHYHSSFKGVPNMILVKVICFVNVRK